MKEIKNKSKSKNRPFPKVKKFDYNPEFLKELKYKYRIEKDRNKEFSIRGEAL